jgi:hypothetical protein
MSANTNVFAALVLSLLVTLPISVSGHHSLAEYDRSVVTEFDAVRTIHMENAADPASVEASHLGYSVGHWEGDTLVEPFVWEAFWTWQQGEAVGLYDCIVEP